MPLRKPLVVTAAAIVAAGLIGTPGASFGATGTVSGQFQSGSASWAGSTYGCTSGTSSGTYDTVNNPALRFSTLSLGCTSPWGVNTISLNSCTVPATLSTGRTAGVDTAIGGSVAFGTTNCVKVSALFGVCTFNVAGTVVATFNETVKSGGWQDLILNGSGTMINQSSGCGGIYAGTFTLNNIDFNVKPASGSLNFA